MSCSSWNVGMVTPQHSPKRSQKANISAKFGSDAHTSCAAALATSGENVVSGLTIATGGLPTAMRYIIPNSGKNLNFRESKSKQIKNKQITKVSRICSHHFDIPLFEPENVQCYRGGHCSVGVPYIGRYCTPCCYSITIATVWRLNSAPISTA